MPTFEDWWWEYWQQWAERIARNDPRQGLLTSEQLGQLAESVWNAGYQAGVNHALDTVGAASFEPKKESDA